MKMRKLKRTQLTVGCGQHIAVGCGEDGGGSVNHGERIYKEWLRGLDMYRGMKKRE